MKNSLISWTHYTFNPWTGCTKVSPGCANCYAEALSKRWGKDIWGPGKARLRTSEAYWKQPLAWDREAATAGERKRVFCASMADVFDPDIQWTWKQDLWRVIRLTRNLDWLILTKRPENALNIIWAELDGIGGKNVWMGASVEDQKRADTRIPTLLKIPAVIHFLSVEPLLEPVDLGNITEIDWVIIGGESGPHARPMKLEWAINIVEQCKARSVACFVKQLGGYPNKREDISMFPPELQIRQFPK